MARNNRLTVSKKAARRDTGSDDLGTYLGAGRADGWQNLLTGLGDVQRDKRLSGFVRTDNRLTYEGLRALYGHDDVAAKAVDLVAGDMCREWFDVKVEDGERSQEIAKAIADKLDVLGARFRFEQALQWQRAYGGAGILIGANDKTANLEQPLNDRNVRDVEYLNVFDASELHVIKYYDNPLAAKFGEPEVYRIVPRALLGASTRVLFDVHESRILRFSGPVPSRDTLAYNQGWGDSVLQRAYDVIRDFGQSFESAAALLPDFAQGVYKIRGLADSMAADDDESVIKRIKLIDMARSVLRAAVLDAEGEDFERKSTSVAGLSDLLDRFAQRLASALDIPVTRLMGMSPAGLNATGASDARNYYDHVAAKQRKEVVPPLSYLVRLIMLSKVGPTEGEEAESWQVCPRPLWQLDDVQKADARSKMAQADAVYLDRGVVTPDEVAQSRFGGDGYSLDTALDAEHEEFDPTAPDEFEDEAGTMNAAVGGAPAAIQATTDAAPSSGRPPAPGAAQAPAPALSKGPTTATPRGLPLEPGAAPKASDAILQGPQVKAVLDLVLEVVNGKLPRETALGVLVHLYKLAPEQAEAIVGSAGQGFKPKEDPAPAVAAPAVASPPKKETA